MQPDRPVHEFHQSWLSTLFECPEQARLIHRDLYPRDQTEAAASGTAVHAAIQAVVVDDASFEDALQRGVDTFRTLEADEAFRWVKVTREQTAIKHIENGLLSWWTWELPRLGAPQLVEEPFRFTFYEDDEREIVLAGTIDYVEASGIKDWKLTGNRDKYGKDGWKLKRWGVQPTVYSAALRHWGLYGPDEVVPFEFVALSPQGHKPQVLEAPRSLADVNWLRDQCITAAKQIEANLDEWVKRDQSALCSPKWCTAYATCKGAHVKDPSINRV